MIKEVEKFYRQKSKCGGIYNFIINEDRRNGKWIRFLEADKHNRLRLSKKGVNQFALQKKHNTVSKSNFKMAKDFTRKKSLSSWNKTSAQERENREKIEK